MIAMQLLPNKSCFLQAAARESIFVGFKKLFKFGAYPPQPTNEI
jgi:hypothetical protein